MSWIYENTPYTTPDATLHGFVYLIENTLTGKKYLGKKSFWMTKYKTVKKKRKKIKAPSDWQTYYGSNKTLMEDVQTHGPEHFTRTILRLCTSKAECSYFEAKYQFTYGVLESPDWYNEWIMVRVRKSNVKSFFPLDKTSAEN
jgi:hypothetical protein